MAEIGVDISEQQAKDLALFDGEEMDYVIALCAASAQCSPGQRRRFMSTSRTRREGNRTEEKVPAAYRRSRDDIID